MLLVFPFYSKDEGKKNPLMRITEKYSSCAFGAFFPLFFEILNRASRKIMLLARAEKELSIFINSGICWKGKKGRGRVWGEREEHFIVSVEE